MKNKKTIMEIFEFFPNINWITKDSGVDGSIALHVNKPLRSACMEYLDGSYRSGYVSDEESCIILDSAHLQTDWGTLRTWKQRCIGRKGVKV
jgi:hypothetical protein